MAVASAVVDAVAGLTGTFSGQILREADPGYDEARRVHNGLVDKRPALIARCHGAADVVDAVNLARTHGLEVSVRGGGHNVAGRAVTDGGLMIDLAPMKGIQVDPNARVARAQPGLNWAEFNRETQLHGLATTGGVVSTTGIAGLTLGGGLGWLMGRYGMAVDNLLSVQLVLADGRVVTADDGENPDLFWAVRGGGGNFGVAVSFEYRLHPLGPTVTGGLAVHPLPAARDVLRFFRDVTVEAPDELTVMVALTHAPDGSGTPIVALALCHCGPLEEGAQAVKPIKAFGPPVMDMVGPMPYTAVNQMLDAAYPRGAFNYWKSNFLAGLSDDAIDAMADAYDRCPSPMTDLILEPFHGAVTRVGVGDTAFPHRTEGYNFLVLSQWTNPRDGDRCKAWARETYATMQPFFATGRFVSYLDDDETGDPVAAAYGPNYDRLRKLKTEYDPTNFFHLNQNIRPLS